MSKTIADDPNLRAFALKIVRDTLKFTTSIRYKTPWKNELLLLERNDWEERIKDATDPTVQIPAWFQLPIHGVEGGNDLEQAKEQSPAMQAMASLFGYREGMSDVRVPHLRVFSPKLVAEPKILDVGCGTGDSMHALKTIYPDAKIFGIDLSPQMVAVGKVRYPDSAFVFIHRAGEDMRFPDNVFDMVNECAVAHEVPWHQTIQRFKECFRVLKPGAPFFFLDQDPASPIIKRQLTNGKLGTYIEPHIRSYCKLKVREELQKIGFVDIKQKKINKDATVIVYVAWKPRVNFFDKVRVLNEQTRQMAKLYRESLLQHQKKNTLNSTDQKSKKRT